MITDDYPRFGYSSIDPARPVFTVHASDIVHGDIDKSFALTSDWTATSPFWSKTLDLVPVDEKGRRHGVGDVRHFSTNGRKYSEILLNVDVVDRSFAYGLTVMDPPMLEGVVTYASFEPVDDASFRVTWRNIFQPAFDGPALVAMLKAGQTAGYKAIIDDIKLLNNPEVGTVRVVIEGGSASRLPSRLDVRVANGAATTVSTNSDGSLVEPLNLEHKVISYDEQIVVSLYGHRLFAQGPWIARGYLSLLSTDKNTATEGTTVRLKDTVGRPVGKYKVRVELDWVHPPPTNPSTVVGDIAFMIFNNLKAKVMEIATNATKNSLHHAVDPKNYHEIYGYSSYSSEFGELPKYCSVLPTSAAILPKRVAQLFQRNTEYLYSQGPIFGLIGILTGASGNPNFPNTATGKIAMDQIMNLFKDPFRAPFKGPWVKAPELVIESLKDAVKSDQEICGQLIRGANPMNITMATSVFEIPVEMHGLIDAEGRNLTTLMDSKNLLFCDYEILGLGEYDEELGVYKNQADAIGGKGKMGPMKYWYNPFLLIVKNAEGKLDVLGFILTRFTDKANTVYNRKTTAPNVYKLAQLHLTCADNQDHQFIQHLGIGHLCMESFAIANNNAFPRGPNRHPIGNLLHPHFQDTIGINFLARQTLVSEIAPFTDTTFSPGTKNGMKIFARAYKKWDFFGDNFVNNLRARGFDEAGSDGLEGFYYRDDGFKLWNIFKRHFGRIISKIYGSDSEVASDAAIQGWCEEMREEQKGSVKSFPQSIHSIELLTETITTIVFYCSAQHASVNYAQLDYVTYVPNRPDCMRRPMLSPESEENDIAPDLLYAALPSIPAGHFQTLFAYLLTTPPDNPFGMYDTIENQYGDEVKLFKEEMQKQSEEIDKRNEKLVANGEMPYTYLRGNSLAQSVNI